MVDYYYVYAIDFSDGTVYYGSRKSKVPFEKDFKYVGSPKTHKHKWKDPNITFKKRHIASFRTLNEAREWETRIIKGMWLNFPGKCINENAGGKFNHAACVRGGKASKRRPVRFRREDESFVSESGIRPMCRLLNLDYGSACKILRGQRKTCRGWSLEYV